MCALLGFPADAATVGQALIAGAVLILGVLSLLCSGTSRSRPATLVALAGCFCGLYLWPRGPPAARDDCARLVVTQKLDSSPHRTPQAVHTALLARFVGKDVAEMGSRAGDGIACFAQRARSATAIETEETLCALLHERSRNLALGTRTGFDVLCTRTSEAYVHALPDADAITWWAATSKTGPRWPASATQRLIWPRLTDARVRLRHGLSFVSSLRRARWPKRVRSCHIGGPRHR